MKEYLVMIGKRLPKVDIEKITGRTGDTTAYGWDSYCMLIVGKKDGGIE
jgi:hypothetical protein